MPNRSSKNKVSASELAKAIMEAAASDPDKDPLAVALGRRGGLKGGRARADSLTAEQRSEIARKAAAARWKNKN